MSYYEDPIAYDVDIEHLNLHAEHPDLNLDLYSPYSSDELLSSRFFDSTSSATDSDDQEPSSASGVAVDPFVWCNRFQESLREVRQLEVQTVPHRNRIQTWQKLASVASDFIHAATTYGKIIISEAYVPAEEKTIKPLSGRGIAGGEKYIINSIMFKFAIDKANLFDQDDYKASRVAGHDLLGLNCYLAAAGEDLSTPLVCLLDFRGFRLVALSLLPIGRDTLVYGSDDAGSHIRTDDEVHEKLLKCAKVMNTAEHTIVELATLQKCTIATAIDVEVHRSRLDGRYYVVDCSRAMPPSASCRDPRYKGKSNHLTMLLRPELVRQFVRPLNCDTFASVLFPKQAILRKIQQNDIEEQEASTILPAPVTTRELFPGARISIGEQSDVYYSDSSSLNTSSDAFSTASSSSVRTGTPTSTGTTASQRASTPRTQLQNENTRLKELLGELEEMKARAEADVTDATNQLLSVIIPKFADSLVHLLEILPDTQQSIFAYDWFVVWLHWHGINIRHLGALRACVPKENKSLRGLLLNIMVSRVLKNMCKHRLRMEMKRLKYAGEYPYQLCLVNFLNLAFGSSTESLSFWNLPLKHALLYQFPDALTDEELKHDLRVLVLDTPIVDSSHSRSSRRKRALSTSIAPSSLHSYHNTHETADSSAESKPSHSPLHTSSTSSPSHQQSEDKLDHTFLSGSNGEANVELPTVAICFLFFSVCRLLGLKLQASHMRNFASNPALFNVAHPLDVLDLDGAPETVNTLQIVSHAQGLVWKARAEAASALPQSKLFAADMWKLSLDLYKRSLLSNPRDQRTIRNVAEVYHSLGFDELAGVFAHLAIETNPNDAVSMYKYATFVWATTRNEETAKRYYEAGIRCTNITPGAYLAYAEFCLKLKRFEQATALVQRCLELYPNSWDARHKMAYIQHFITKQYDEAHLNYKRAMELEQRDLVLLRHYITFLRTIVLDESLASTYESYLRKMEQQSTIMGRGSKLWGPTYIASPLPTPL